MKKKILLSVFFTMIFTVIIALGDSTDAFAGTNSWLTYDDTNPNITYSSGVSKLTGSSSYFYGGTYHGFIRKRVGETARFNFTGNKLAIYGEKYTHFTGSILVTIDGVNYSFSAYAPSSYYKQQLFSVTNLEEGEHSVIIEEQNPSPANCSCYDFVLDSIAVDSDDVLLPYNYNQNNAILKIGTDCTATMGKDVPVNLYMDRVTNIGAVAVKIKYDASKLEFTSLENVEGIRTLQLIKGNGQVEFVLSCNSEEDFINVKKVIGKMHFKVIGTGSALIDVVSGEISDCETMDRSLNNLECGYGYLPIN